MKKPHPLVRDGVDKVSPKALTLRFELAVGASYAIPMYPAVAIVVVAETPRTVVPTS
jgi:hypothetical protein